ncbi:hypothetical protein ACFOHT_04885 [Massilia oculi]|uniref:Uncharacterized protein n=1 Tax=Massilia oculi TaxID=945844 RepID=A0A2S2DDE8_9BURK|nr:hypothetical protein [Massilia oculi]AWL03403.1 hypothetical protein DIR46_02335 [Massilia oculi]
MTATKRYYVSNVQLYGPEEDPINEPVVGEYTRDFGAAYAADLSWALALAKSQDHSGMLADPRLLALPDFGRDDPVSSIPSAEIVTLADGLAARGISAAFLATAATFKDIVEGIGKQAFPTFTYGGMQIN